MKWCSLRGPAQPPPCPPNSRRARLAAVRPTATPGWAWRPPAIGGPVRGAAGPHPYPPPLRGRAPPLPPLAARPAPTTAALREKREETAPVMEEFAAGEGRAGATNLIVWLYIYANN